MRYARYYQLNRATGKLQQALGSDSIIIFDSHAGALTPLGRHNQAIAHAQKLNRLDGLNKGYVGYAMFKGASIMTACIEQRQVFPTGVEYLPVCAEAKPEDVNLWR